MTACHQCSSTLSDHANADHPINLLGADLREANLREQSFVRIQGSRHTVDAYGSDRVTIGCHERSLRDWLITYQEIGKREGYSDSEIQEYGVYLRMLEERWRVAA